MVSNRRAGEDRTYDIVSYSVSICFSKNILTIQFTPRSNTNAGRGGLMTTGTGGGDRRGGRRSKSGGEWCRRSGKFFVQICFQQFTHNQIYCIFQTQEWRKDDGGRGRRRWRITGQRRSKGGGGRRVSFLPFSRF